FEQAISADVLELAFFVTPPGEYLWPSTGGQPSWRKQPHYFSLYRAEGQTGRAVFTAGAEISKHIAEQAEVTVSSRDAFIRATAPWPAMLDARAPRPSYRWAVAAILVLLLLLGGAGYWLYPSQEQGQWFKP